MGVLVVGGNAFLASPNACPEMKDRLSKQNRLNILCDFSAVFPKKEKHEQTDVFMIIVKPADVEDDFEETWEGSIREYTRISKN